MALVAFTRQQGRNLSGRRQGNKTIKGKTYLLEYPFEADVALIFANKADEMGNLQYSGSENNFNQLMAACAKQQLFRREK